MSILRLIRSTVSLVRMLAILDLSCEENVVWNLTVPSPSNTSVCVDKHRSLPMGEDTMHHDDVEVESLFSRKIETRDLE